MSGGPFTASLSELAAWARATMIVRPNPDFIIGPGEPDYIRRWWVIPRNDFMNLYLHLTRRSDDDRALHDHPWPNTSFVLEGGYWEIMPEPDGTAAHGPFRRVWRAPGAIVTRGAADAHRLEIPDGGQCVSLFATGPMVREWGFHCPNGWQHWKEFTGYAASGSSGTIGPGCE